MSVTPLERSDPSASVHAVMASRDAEGVRAGTLEGPTPTPPPDPPEPVVPSTALALMPNVSTPLVRDGAEGTEIVTSRADEDGAVMRPASLPIGRGRTRRVQVEGRAALKAARRAIQHATIYVHTVAAMAKAAHQIDDAELLALRALLKRGRHRRRLDAGSANHLERDLRGRAAELAQRLPDPALALRDAQQRADEHVQAEDARRTSETDRRKARAHTRGARQAMRAEGKVVLAVLTKEQAETAATRQRVLHAIELGASWQEACAKEGVVASRATVSRWRKARRELGPEGLVDGRILNGRTGLAPEVRALALAAYQHCRGGKSGSVYATLRAKCEATGLPIPSHAWVADFIRYEIPADVKLVREEGLAEWRRQAAPRHTVERARFANELWQCDDTPLDVWVRSPLRDGHWEVLQPYATAIIDVHSRACMAIGVWSRTPNAWSVALTLRKAILPKASEHAPFRGVPVRFAMDNGKNYRSDALSQTLAFANIRKEHCAPHSPNQKPQIERFLRTLQENLLPQLPGYKKANMVSEGAAAKAVMTLLTIEQLRAEIDRWVDVYNASHHTGISKSFDYTPRQLWQESVRLHEIDPALLHRLLLHSAPRVVQQKGVQLTLRTGDTVFYWAPTLTDRFQERVIVAFNPEDLASVLVTDAATGLPICEAFRMDGAGGRYTGEDIRRAQEGRAAQLAGVVERLGDYAAEAERTDRRSPARTREAEDFLARLRAAEDAELSHPLLAAPRALPPATEDTESSTHPLSVSIADVSRASPGSEPPKVQRTSVRNTRAVAPPPESPASPLDGPVDPQAAAAERALMQRLSRISGGRL